MADDFNKVNYDHIFKEEKAVTEKPLEKISSIGSRIGEIFFGIMFGGIALVVGSCFFYAAYCEVVQHVTFKTAEATVSRVEGTLEDSQITLAWSFTANGEKYTGKETVTESDNEKNFDEVAKIKIADKFPVAYKPDNPEVNLRYKPFDPSTIFILLFVVPFVTTGYLIITGKLRENKKVEPGSKEYPGVLLIILLFLLCCPGAFGFMFLNNAGILPWPAVMVSFVLYAFGAIPFLIVFINCKIQKAAIAKKADESTESHAASIAEDAESRSSDIDTYQKASFKKEVLPQLLFTLFWWLILSVFISFMGYQTYRYIYANEFFTCTKGKVLSAEVKAHRGDDSTTYSPEIKYVYHVNGKKYIGKKYDLAGGSSSGGWADRIVREYPKGKKVTVYYAQSDPSDSVLSIEMASITRTLMLFLQPFIAAGIFMLYFTIVSVIAYIHSLISRHDTSEPKPSRKTLWAKPEVSANLLEISFKSKPNVFTTFIFGYGISTFFMIFIAAIVYDFNLTLGQIFMCLKIAAGVGGLAVFISLLKYLFRKPEIFKIDMIANIASLSSSKINWQLQLNDIKTLCVEELVSSFSQNNQPLKSYRLQFVDNQDNAYTIHELKCSMVSDRYIIMKTLQAGETLARFIGCRFDRKIVQKNKDKELPAIFKKIIRIPNKKN